MRRPRAQQQQRQQMQATSEIAQRSPEPSNRALPILSFGKAQREKLRVASACDERFSERYRRGRDSEDPFDAPPLITYRMRGRGEGVRSPFRAGRDGGGLLPDGESRIFDAGQRPQAQQ